MKTFLKNVFYILGFLGFLICSPILALASVTFTPDPLSGLGVSVTYTCDTGTIVGLYDTNDNQLEGADTCTNTRSSIDYAFSAPTTHGIYTIVETTDNPPCSDSATLADCRNDADYVSETTFCFIDSCGGGGGGGGGIDDQFLLNASTTDSQYLGGINFGLAILITLNSLMLVGFTFNTLNKRKKIWQK